MKTLTSHGATGEMSVVGRTTPNARVEVSKERGNVADGSDQWRGHWGRSAHYSRSRVWNRNNDGSIVVKCVRESNCGGRLVRSDGSGGRGRGDWRLSLLLSLNVGDYGGGWGNLRAALGLNQKRLEAVDDVWGDEFGEDIVTTALEVLQRLF